MNANGNDLHTLAGLCMPADFLEEYWQIKPCLIRQAFADIKPLLDADDLAGLACEEFAESRLITGCFEAADWTLNHGPFSEEYFSSLPESNWTLLVQDTEKHYPPLQSFMQHFGFIPGWRLDDLMISYAASGGSVGPHTDQYDVFLVQVEGTRRWQIATSFESELLENCPLDVLRRFSPEYEWVLQPGDMLYLPPEVAHHGVALEPGMTWSVGSKAPSAADLLQGLGEWLAYSDDGGGRYSDPGLKAVARSGEINATALRKLRRLMLKGIKKGHDLDNYLAAFMSRFRLASEVIPPDLGVTAEHVMKALEQGEMLHRNPWTRLVWIETPRGARLFAAGQAYECNISLADEICKYTKPRIIAARLDNSSLRCITALINDGHFSLHPD